MPATTRNTFWNSRSQSSCGLGSTLLRFLSRRRTIASPKPRKRKHEKKLSSCRAVCLSHVAAEEGGFMLANLLLPNPPPPPKPANPVPLPNMPLAAPPAPPSPPPAAASTPPPPLPPPPSPSRPTAAPAPPLPLVPPLADEAAAAEVETIEGIENGLEADGAAGAGAAVVVVAAEVGGAEDVDAALEAAAAAVAAGRAPHVMPPNFAGVVPPAAGAGAGAPPQPAPLKPNDCAAGLRALPPEDPKMPPPPPRPVPAAPNNPVAGAGAGAAAVDPAVEVAVAVEDGVEDDVAIVVGAANPEPKLGGFGFPAETGAGAGEPAPKPVAVAPVPPPAVEAGAEAGSSVGLCTLLAGPEVSEAGASGRLAMMGGEGAGKGAATRKKPPRGKRHKAGGHKRKSVESVARKRGERMLKAASPGRKRWQESYEHDTVARGGTETAWSNRCKSHRRHAEAPTTLTRRWPIKLKIEETRHEKSRSPEKATNSLRAMSLFLSDASPPSSAPPPPSTTVIAERPPGVGDTPRCCWEGGTGETEPGAGAGAGAAPAGVLWAAPAGACPSSSAMRVWSLAIWSSLSLTSCWAFARVCDVRATGFAKVGGGGGGRDSVGVQLGEKKTGGVFLETKRSTKKNRLLTTLSVSRLLTSIKQK